MEVVSDIKLIRTDTENTQNMHIIRYQFNLNRYKPIPGRIDAYLHFDLSQKAEKRCPFIPRSIQHTLLGNGSQVEGLLDLGP